MNRGTSKKSTSRNKVNAQAQKPKPNINKQQNICEFKLEIDHEIAKCLDTLDRQGLKYLRETLRSSNIFNLQDIKEDKPKPAIKDKDIKSEQANKQNDEIQQEIIEEYQIAEEPTDPNITRLGTNDNKPLEIQNKVKLQKFEEVLQEPIKPFSRKGTRSKLQPLKQQEIKKNAQKQKQSIQDKTQIDEIVQKIKALPDQKLKKLGKIIDKLDRPQEENPQSARTHQPYMFKVEAGTLSNHSSARSGSNQSKRKEKATSLHDPIIRSKRSGSSSKHKQNDPLEREDEQNSVPEEEIQENWEVNDMTLREPATQMSEDQTLLCESKGDPLQKEPGSAQQSILKNTRGQFKKKSSFAKNFPLSSSLYRKPLDIQITESNQVENVEMSQNKMMRVGKKKLGTNKVQIILVRNRGHPTVIGLTGIQFYNMGGNQIGIGMDNVRAPNSIKVLKLFNGINKTTNGEEMFTTVFKRDFEIQLQVPEKIGGVKIWNYNKSEIQSNKEVDWIQIYINGKEAWQGLVKKGSYNELEDYETQIQLQQNFVFKKDNPKINQNQTDNQQLPIQNKEKETKFSFQKGPKQKQNSQKVEWLEKTLVEEKMKEFQNKEDQQKQIPQKRTISNRFSQIYQESEQGLKLADFPKKDPIPIEKEKKPNQEGQADSQRFASKKLKKKQTFKRLQDEMDIFASIGKSGLRDPVKANQGEKKQEQQEDKMINYMKDQSEAELQKPEQSIPIDKEYKVVKNTHQKSLDDFMNDSIFQEPARINIRQKNQQKIAPKKNPPPMIREEAPEKKEQVNIDEFLNELDDLVGEKIVKKGSMKAQKKQAFGIPELPRGNQMEIVLESNWGDTQFLGLNKIQFFNSEGERVFPVEAKQSTGSQKMTFYEIFSNKNGINNHSSQCKWQKKDRVSIQLVFSKKIEISLIRFWNYMGDRVHSMVGVKRISIILDGAFIFIGEIRKMGASSIEEEYRSCENILFTSNRGIQKRIASNDWLSQEIQGWKEERIIFKKTLQGFHRPQTKGDTIVEPLKMAEDKSPIKLPKRQCFEYDPPSSPIGFFLKLVLHSTWGDRNFIGLNGVVIYDTSGNEIKKLKKISEYPAALCVLPGYEGDKRILKNLFNRNNHSNLQEDTWLSTLLSDLDKMQKQSANSILIEFEEATKIGAINFYNYTKTPDRGVREIQIFMDKMLVYRGFIRKAGNGQVHTTINFTKETPVLQKIGYSGYHEDNLTQPVVFYNEGKMAEAR